MSKSFLQQLQAGLLNAIGIDVKEPKELPVIPKGKGVVIPKLQPIPTVKRGKNINKTAAKNERLQKKQIAKLSNRIAKIERAELQDRRRDAAMLKKINYNKRAIEAQKRLIKKQQRWVSFMFKRWEQKNAKALNNMNAKLRAKLVREQKAYLRKLAQIRINSRYKSPVRSTAPKKK